MIKDKKDFEMQANAYFDACEDDGRLFSEAGLALYLSTPLEDIRSWWDGTKRKDLQGAVKMAYLRIQEQIDINPAYRDKGMVSRSNFLNKQKYFGGYQDKAEVKQDIAIDIKFGKGMEDSDFD